MRMNSITRFSKQILLLGTLAAFTFVGTGCDLARNQMKMDRSGNMSFQDYRDSLSSRVEDAGKQADSKAADAGIPAMKPYIVEPSDNLKPMPLVSISINQTVPLREALYELAEQANYDLEIDPRIQGSIIFTARERPFDIVIKRISELAGLRYNFKEGVLRVEVDTAYNKTYKIDYLSYIRTSKGEIKNDVSVVSGEGAKTGSSFETTSTSEANFWGELDATLSQMLNSTAAGNAMRTESDPAVSNSASMQVPIVNAGNVGAVPPPALPAATPVGAAAGPDGNPQAVLNVTTLEPSAGPTTTASSSRSASGQQPVNYAINKQAGIISVHATQIQHEMIAAYLKELRRAVTAQVLIEAKVLEVSLSDEFSTGIDWSTLDFLSPEASIAFDIAGTDVDLDPLMDPVAGAKFKAFYTGNDINAAVHAVSRFGTVKALASPRLTVLNNQSAVLNVASNQVYFELDVTTTPATTNSDPITNVNSNIRNIPEGILINVQPSIDLDTRTVSMAVRPTITKIVNFVEDPAVQFAVSQNPNVTGVQSRVPVVNVQEMDSVVRMGSGQALIMGGLMQDNTRSEEIGVPILSEVPLLGSLFKTHGDSIKKSELIIFLRATIIDDGAGGVDSTDKDLYRRFSDDRRPLNM